jgi:hypothetical protein
MFGGASRQLDAIHFRHDDIGQQQVVRLLADGRKGTGAFPEGNYRVPRSLKRAHKETPHILVVLGKNDLRHEFPNSQAAAALRQRRKYSATLAITSKWPMKPRVSVDKQFFGRDTGEMHNRGAS